MSSLFVTSCVRALPSPSLLVLALLAWVTAFLKGLSCCCFPFVLRFVFGLFLSFVRSPCLTLVSWVPFLLRDWPGGFLNALIAI